MALQPYATLALLLSIVWLFYGWLYNWRFKKFKHIPQSHPANIFLGNLSTIGTACAQLEDSRRHPGSITSSL